MQYRAYGLKNFRSIPELEVLSERQKRDIEIVGSVLPFKANNFVVEHLIDWSRVPDDPIYQLVFPQPGMLLPHHYDRMAALHNAGADRSLIQQAANDIRMELNPHPAGQLEHNAPRLGEQRLPGMQHKYEQTVLFFPSHGQTCHAYCSFCFRWPQFVGMQGLKLAARQADQLIEYLHAHDEVTDVLITGGDPMIMSTQSLAAYLQPLIDSRPPNLRRIRIGTKALSYWPYRFSTDRDASDLLGLLQKVVDSGIHLAIMAHVNHPRELEPPPVRDAIRRLRSTGAEIRTQSPLMRHINDDATTWRDLWNTQVDLGCVPYYMFLARDTGAQHYFSVPLVRALQIYQDANESVSGLCRTARGPSMSADPGKVQVLAVTEVAGKRVLELRFLQARNPKWVNRTFFAELDHAATWLDDLRPAFGEPRFFFETDVKRYYRENLSSLHGTA